MENWLRYTFFAVGMLFAAQSMAAAGDYVLEGKFRSELAKAEQGDPKAQYAVGEMYEKGRGVDRDLRSAFSWYSKASQKGNMKAEYKLGMAYLNGKGIRKNYRKAYEWLKKSSDKGYVRAQYYLGTLYEEGLGTEQNIDKALKWYKLALQGGYDMAASGIQRITQRQERLESLRRAAIAKAAQLKKKTASAAPAATPVAAPVAKAEAGKVTTKQRIQAGGWKKHGKPSEFLPSAITRCKDLGSRMECLSKTIIRNIGMADINYQTKATIFDFKDDGTFRVSYRNKVTAITITDEEFANSGASVPVRKGWQDAEHKLDCSLENDSNITCKKNKLASVKLHR